LNTPLWKRGGRGDLKKLQSTRGYKIKKLSKLIATLGFIGYLPYAPGTFGSAAGFLFMVLLKPGDIQLLISFLLLFFIGVWSSHGAEKFLGKDSGHIVIDEFCGYLISVLFIPQSTGYLFAAFLLFRAFDILKPPPIRKIEGVVPGGAGVMLDDVLAGIYANVCLQTWRYLL
jgi:phosphatidylglycerophosphatase A